MKSFQRYVILFPVFISAVTFYACTRSAAPQESVPPPPFILITSAPNPSPTPTPFQPSLYTPTQPSLASYNLATPTPQQILPTETASPTPIPPIDPTATADVNQLFPTLAAPPVAEPVAVAPTALPPLTDNETINFLLIGSDKRPGSSYRTDTLVVAVVWPKEGQVSLISIPRDLWIYIPTVGMQRINTAYQSGEITGYTGGGPGLLKDTVAYNFGIRIDHTAMVEFDGFRRIVDTLGGIEVPIACAYTDWRLIDPSYDPENENNWWLYTVGPGQVHMDGDLALWYARSRSKSNDFDRGRRQQETLRSIFAKALQTDTFSKIPQLYNDFSSTVITDLGLGDLLLMSPYAVNFTNANIRGYYIRPPYVSSWTTPGGAAVLLPNEAELGQMLIEATTLSTSAVERKVIKVDVQNGTPNDAWDALAASRLNYAGYQTTLSNADRRDYSSSVIIDFTPGQDTNQRQTIISSLNLYSANVISLPDANSPVQYRVILGYDYDPCFQPQDLSH
ncbi:Polyisoprenyl-teichoic acid--peptidoglycan teichoic acid transferase TagU [Anaerolineales bacterium]|nr:Polyisoprenyl-teichoic acid--peptidoglycan teichoic acid transferase TagU [Anaerolineales bacterium]